MKNTAHQDLFGKQSAIRSPSGGKTKEPFGRLDGNRELHDQLVQYCRLNIGEVWEDPVSGHRVGVLDATKPQHLKKILGNLDASLVVNDPPYNIGVGNMNTHVLPQLSLKEYISFSRQWVQNCACHIAPDSHFYIWLGADIRDDFQPLPDFMLMMRDFREFTPRNLITLRNQRGYGTQANWMWVRQELLHYIHGKPSFSVVYTDIPKILRGYYKTVNGRQTENLERSKSKNIRPGNVWIDVQQVFYRMEENVSGCYAQKPLKAIERILCTSSHEGDIVLDCFAHSGTTLIAGERLKRTVVTFDIDPVFAELTIRRLENYRKTGRIGWQWHNPFPELEKARESGATT